MTPASWARMKEIFLAARKKPQGEREAFLSDACSDASLRQEVRRLLAAEDQPRLESPVAGMLATPALPAAIGRYRIVRLLGEGGMGAVYEAEQEQPRRTVALKVIKPGLASRELIRRFEHESQALGRLHHPGIAQIYEAGTADSGFGPQPYFAMELIQGASLLRYAEAHRLSTRERLELVAMICEAVHHAHQRGIIHRDLKPGNILVDEAGQPKILDFGVARVTDADAQATHQTDVGQLVGTLAYMSPEQVLGDPLELDTRSDVYALGVMLYELLAGRLPYQLGGQLPKAVQTIREEDPARLSSISRTYRGDIETIVAKALEKQKARRYSSAAEMAADIQRYLRDEPIAARRSSTTYHLRKFARRHSSLVIGLTGAFVLLTAGIVASTWQARRAWRAEQEALRQRDWAAIAQRAAQKERDRAVSAEGAATAERDRAVAERQRADTESATAKAISDFLQNDLLSQASARTQARPDNRPDPDLKVRTALDRAAARIAGRFDRQPLVEAAIRQTIGATYKDLGVYQEAERQFQRALDLRRRSLGAEHPDTLDSMTSLAELYSYEGKYAAAEPLLTRLVNLRRRLNGEEHPSTLTGIWYLADLYRLQGKWAPAERLFLHVLEWQRRVLGEEHHDTRVTMGSLATLYRQQGKYAEAEPFSIKIMEIQRRTHGDEHPDTMVAMNNLAALYAVERKYTEAEALLTQCLDIRRRVAGAQHPETLKSMHNLADLYRREKKYALAEKTFLEALEGKRRVLGEEHPSTLSTVDSLALLYRVEGRYREAEPLQLQSLEAQRRILGEEHPNTVVSLVGLAILYQEEGKYSEAEPLLTKAVETSRRILGMGQNTTRSCMTSLAKLRLTQHRYQEAEPLLRESLNAETSEGPNFWQPCELRSLLGASLAGQSKFVEAEPLLISGYRGLLQRSSAVPMDVSIPQAGERIVQLYTDWDKPDKAAEWRNELQAAGLGLVGAK
jgi:tetratricopeptide (TPR) repeat protein